MHSKAQVEYLRDVLGICAFIRPPEENFEMEFPNPSQDELVQEEVALDFQGPKDASLIVFFGQDLSHEEQDLFSKIIKAIDLDVKDLAVWTVNGIRSQVVKDLQVVAPRYLSSFVLCFGNQDFALAAEGTGQGHPALPFRSELFEKNWLVVDSLHEMLDSHYPSIQKEKKQRTWKELKQLKEKLESR